MTTITIIGMGLCGNASFCQRISHFLSQESRPESPIIIRVFDNKKNISPAVPLTVTKMLLELLKSGEVQEKAGLHHILFDETNQEFVIYFSSGEIKTTKYLVDTSGYSYGINNSREPFIEHAVAKGYLTPKPQGGIEISAAGQPKNNQGKVQPTLFCIGPVASFADKYPTPYASFMVGNATEKAAKIIRDDLLRQTISSYRFDKLITLDSCFGDCFYRA